MDYSFIPAFLSQLISNNGLRPIYIMIIATFGIKLIYNLVAGWIKNRNYF